ncbi:MAG: hypothetical protein U0791_00245 [Gemmataceae bacterium]
MRWECRYSSCEMMYLEVGVHSVRNWLDHSKDRADEWTFAEVMAGECDGLVRAVFGDDVLRELKSCVASLRPHE